VLLVPTFMSAQVDINKMIQERMAKQGQQVAQPGQPGGMKIEDDNDPFVPNSFIGSYRMEMHMFEKDVEKKDSPMNLRYYGNAEMMLMKNDMMARDGREMTMLTDLKGKWQYVLMTDEKGKKTAMKSHKKKVIMDKKEAEDKRPEIAVTNETKTIDGYACTKVIVKSEDGIWTGWVAKGVKGPFADMARNIEQHGGAASLKLDEGVDGFPMEYEWVDAKSGDRIVCYTRDLKIGEVDPSIFSLDGYEVMEMPSFVH
jgi:hypothetical protein